ncbi:MAG: hypothetical protein ACK5PP_05835 [Acidimicrobiales bacterium]
MTSRRIAALIATMGVLLLATLHGSNAAFSAKDPETASFSAAGDFNDLSRLSGVSAPASASLVWWLDSAKATTVFADSACTTPSSVGGSVQCWADRRPGRSKLVATTAAQRTSTTIAGHAPIRFAGMARMAGPDLLASTGSVTIYLVVRENVRMQNMVFSLNGDATANYGRFTLHPPWTDGTVYFDPGDVLGNRARTPINSMTTGIPALIAAWKDPVEARNHVQVDRKQIFDSTGFTVAATSGGLRLGAVGTIGANHDLAEVLVFSSTLSQTDRYHIAQYLQTKWGTP